MATSSTEPVAQIPEMSVPADNQVTPARISLGRSLFFDKHLSKDSTVSCQSCHRPELAFTDGQNKSKGIQGLVGDRNAPSLLNAGFRPLLNWDGGVKSLDLQALVPIEDEREMGISAIELVARLKSHRSYQQMAMAAYGDSLNAFVITRALATFIRTLISSDSSFDQYTRGDSSALTDQALEGMSLFHSARLNCSSCHNGFHFSNDAFENNGMSEVGGDAGRAMVTLDTLDIGKFRVPSLRNVVHTAPYMHNGSLSDLDDVLDHYIEVGRSPKIGQSDKLKAFDLSHYERQALIAFLESLSDLPDSADFHP